MLAGAQSGSQGWAPILTTPNVASAFSIQEMLAGSSPYIYGSYNVGGRRPAQPRIHAEGCSPGARIGRVQDNGSSSRTLA